MKQYFVAKKARDAKLMLSLIEKVCAPVEPSDSNRTGLFLWISLFKGHGIRRTFQGLALAECDMGTVGPKMADAYVKKISSSYGDCSSLSVGPIRFAVDGDRVKKVDPRRTGGEAHKSIVSR